jgi:hypothetical protein
MPRNVPIEPLDYFTPMSETLVLYMDKYNYKRGAFKGMITRATPIPDALDLLINSPLTTADEKAIFRKTRTMYAKLLQRVANGERVSDMDFFVAMMVSGTDVFALTDIFDADRKDQGQYVPPTFTQTLNEDGTVKETREIYADGSVTTTQGGVRGVPPSAPKGFENTMYPVMIGFSGDEGAGKNSGQKKKKKQKKRTNKKKHTNKKDGGNDKDSDMVTADDQIGDEMNGSNLTPSKLKNKDGKDQAFGTSFERNLRGAFS